MLVNEAKWVGRTLSAIARADLSPLLNVGSANAEFREKIQPWIDREIFSPLRKRGVVIHHLDRQEGDGVDLCGDLTNHAFVKEVCSRGYKSLLCSNVLEHIADPVASCAALERVIAVGGYLLVTVPNRFPYHPDPIDTMFRPELGQLVELFPCCRLIDGVLLSCGNGWDYVDHSPVVMISKLRRRLLTFKQSGGVKGSASFLPWLFRTFRQACVLLQRYD